MKSTHGVALHSGQRGYQGQDGFGHWRCGWLIDADRIASDPIDGATRMVYRRGYVVVLQHLRNMHTLHCRDVDSLIFDAC
jgi:hypothetical protein